MHRGRMLWHALIQELCSEATGGDEALLEDLSQNNLAQAIVTYLMSPAPSALPGVQLTAHPLRLDMRQGPSHCLSCALHASLLRDPYSHAIQGDLTRALACSDLDV